jgi:hypothetical protein
MLLASRNRHSSRNKLLFPIAEAFQRPNRTSKTMQIQFNTRRRK